MSDVSRLILRSALFALPVALALLAARPAGVQAGGGCHEPPPAEGRGDVVTMTANCFSPTVLRAEPGATISFQNDDPVEHVVYGLQWGGEVAPEQAHEQTFAAPGVYPFQCTFHPFMVGVVIVGDGGSPANTDVTLALAAPPDAEAQPAGDAAASIAAVDDKGSSFPAWAAAVVGLGGGIAATAAVVTYRRRA